MTTEFQSLEELQEHLNRFMYEQNNRLHPHFEGYSPLEMQNILYDTFEHKSPIQIQKLTDEGYCEVPMLNQVKYLLNLVDQNRELKLTNKGFLSIKTVADLYNQGFLKDEFIEMGISKLGKEKDAFNIHLTRLLIELSGLVKKRNNKLSLTKLGKELLSDNHKLLKLLLKVYGSKFNWAYSDGYGENNIGQLGYGFSMVLLSKYGQEKQLDDFYAEKYFKAYPLLLQDIEGPRFGTFENFVTRCYSLRTFDRFLLLFGLVEIEQENRYNDIKYIKRTTLFDQLIQCKPHKSA